MVLGTIICSLGILIFSNRRIHCSELALQGRISNLEQELKDLKARLELLESKPPVDSALDTQSVTYAEALRLAREGLAPDGLADRLGISWSEAELIIALHKIPS